MEQETFEEVLDEYITKVIDPDNGSIKYVLRKKPRTSIIDIREGKRINKTSIEQVNVVHGVRGAKIHTPNGWYDNVYVAAKAEGVTTATIYGRCKSNNIVYKEWYSEKN